MVQIIQDPSRNALSRSFGTGLSTLLQGIAQHKLQDIARQKNITGLEALGFSPEEAQGVSGLPSDIQKEVIKDISAQGREALKATEKTRHEITLGERTAREQDRELAELERLERTGKIDSPLTVRTYQTLGLGHKLSPETQAFEKVARGFLRNAKSVFGARVTNFELDQFQKLFPSLIQSAEGRKMIIDNIRRVNKAARDRAKVMREIIKENKGKVPRNLEDLIEQKIGPELDRLASESLQGIGRGGGRQQQMQELPNASQYAGKKIRDTQTGHILQSNGTQWLPIEG